MEKRLRNTGFPQTFTVTRINTALCKVKKDLSELWMASRYQKGLTGIVAFCPGVETKKTFITSDLKAERQSEQGVETSNKQETAYSPSPQASPLHAKSQLVPHDRLRICSPNPAFPTRHPKRLYRLAKVPSPLILRCHSKPTNSLKNTADSNRMNYELGLIEGAERVKSPVDREVEGDCPLKAVRSFELQKGQDHMLQAGLAPIPTKPRSVLLRRCQAPVQPQTPKQRPVWSDSCMTITSLPRVHCKSRSMPSAPQTLKQPWRALRKFSQAADAHSESSSDAAMLSRFMG